MPACHTLGEGVTGIIINSVFILGWGAAFTVSRLPRESQLAGTAHHLTQSAE